MLVAIFILLAVGILAFAYITSVFGHEGQVQLAPAGISTTEEFDLAYEKRLGWLNDLENEFQTGKIEKNDYMQQKSALEREALAILANKEEFISARINDGKSNIEEMIQDRRMERIERSGGFCVKCGKPLQRSDLFCPSCGSKRD